MKYDITFKYNNILYMHSDACGERNCYKWHFLLLDQVHLGRFCISNYDVILLLDSGNHSSINLKQLNNLIASDLIEIEFLR